MPDIDLYADENKPVTTYYSTTYRVTVPRHAEKRSNDIPFVYVEVDYLGEISIDRRNSNWSGLRTMDIHTDSHAVNSLLMEIYEWLVEWELAEWKRIGPEDSELFATQKLLNTERAML